MVRLQELPSDIAEKIAEMVAADDSNSALASVISLHKTCRLMRMATKSRAVAIALRPQRHFDQIINLEHPAYLRLIGFLAAAGNVEARFLLGMHRIFVTHRDTVHPPLVSLRQAATDGHRLARFVLALAIYRSNDGAASDEEAKQLLRSIGAAPAQGRWRVLRAERDAAHQIIYVITRRFAVRSRLTVPDRPAPGYMCCNFDDYCSENCWLYYSYRFFFRAAGSLCWRALVQ